MIRAEIDSIAFIVGVRSMPVETVTGGKMIHITSRPVNGDVGARWIIANPQRWRQRPIQGGITTAQRRAGSEDQG